MKFQPFDIHDFQIAHVAKEDKLMFQTRKSKVFAVIAVVAAVAALFLVATFFPLPHPVVRELVACGTLWVHARAGGNHEVFVNQGGQADAFRALTSTGTKIAVVAWDGDIPARSAEVLKQYAGWNVCATGRFHCEERDRAAPPQETCYWDELCIVPLHPQLPVATDPA